MMFFMKKIITLSSILMLLAGTAQAENAFGAVEIDKNAFETYSFWCGNKTYFSDQPLDEFQGCDMQSIGVGSGGDKGNLLIAYHGWQTLEDGSKSPKKTAFVEMPNGVLYRLKDTTFLTSPQLQYYFEKEMGRAEGFNPGLTNVLLSRFSSRHLQIYGATFCVEHYLKRPFSGVVGWCQGDRLVGGDVHFLPEEMSFTNAAILAQRYIYDMVIPVVGQKLFNKDTLVALNTDPQGNMYWAFGIPAAKPNRLLGTFSVRVYMDGRIERKEMAGTPPVGDL